MALILCQWETRWQKPPLGTIKVNVDGAWLENQRRYAIGVVAIDHNGIMLEVRALGLVGAHLSETIEACTFREGVCLARKQAVTTDLEEMYASLRELPWVAVMHISRVANRVAHN
ncbi:hypothetical protein V6N13_036848 [Hibiscus sabdariffa]